MAPYIFIAIILLNLFLFYKGFTTKNILIALAFFGTLYLFLYTIVPCFCTKSINENTLIVGTNAEYPNFTFINEHNEFVGFDIDIAKEVAKRLGKTIEIKDRSFDMLIPEAQSGMVHILAAGMTATPEREKQVIFTKPYLHGEPLVIVTLKKNVISSLDDLRDKEVIVNDGFNADTYISSIAADKGIHIKRLPAAAESFMELIDEKTFAYVSAINAVNPFLERYGKDTFNVTPIAGTQENTALGISKHYPELLSQIQPILDAMHADGTIEALKKKWNIQ